MIFLHIKETFSFLAQQQHQQLTGLLCSSNIIPLYPLGFSTSVSIDAFPGFGVLSHSQRFVLCWIHNSLIPVTFSPGPCSMCSQNTVHAALELKREADDMLLFHPPKARGDASKLGLSKVKPHSATSIQHDSPKRHGRDYMQMSLHGLDSLMQSVESVWSTFQCIPRSLNINQFNRVVWPCTPTVK